MTTSTASLAANTIVACDLAESNGVLAHLTAEQTEVLDAARLALMAGDGTATHAVSLVLDRVIEVPVYSWAKVERDFARLIGKAEARGLPVPALTELSRDDRMVTASIIGGAPVFDGWRLVADLEQRTDKETGERSNIVRTARGDECPEQYRDAPEQCLHCGTSRMRNRTFVIAHEDGRATQVGSTCLDEYLGSGALQSWLSWGRLEAAVDGWGSEIWDDDEFASYRGAVSEWGAAVDPADFLAAVCAESRVHGFASSRANPNLATGRSVWGAMQTAAHERVTDDDIARAESILDFIGSGALGSGDFGRSVSTIAGSRVEWMDANTLAAAYSIHAREHARLDEHVPHAAEGAKVVLDLEVTGKRSWFDDAWETYKYAIEFADPDGRTIVWFTSSPRDASGECLTIGDLYRVAAKVKRLGDYRGSKQTEITRPTLREAGEVTKSAPIMRKWAKSAGFDMPEWAWTKAQIKRAAKAA